jgi:dCTP deaminase
MSEFQFSPGVLAVQDLRRAVDAGVIHAPADPVTARQFQPASLDLRLGPVAHRLRCSFLPDSDSAEDQLHEFSMSEIDLSHGAVLEPNRPYLIPLMEELDLPDGMRGKLSPKSSTGRLDVFTRVISDRSGQFDEVRPGYRGKLYLEFVSRTFTIRLQAGQSLNQLRLLSGKVAVSDDELRAANDVEPIAYRDGKPLPSEDDLFSEGLFLSVDLEAREAPVAYRARRNAMALDLALVGSHPQEDYWEPVFTERGDRIILEPEEFYIMASSEAVHIPRAFASEMTAYDPTCGELRTHYAGFFDPGFGGGADKGTARAVLELRAHDVPFMLAHRQRICRLKFEHLTAPTEVSYGETQGANYEGQQLRLGKHFQVVDPTLTRL